MLSTMSRVGIGIDDMFILISAWRYTSFKLSPEERLGRTLKDAAVSITITSITDALAFAIGTKNMSRTCWFFSGYDLKNMNGPISIHYLVSVWHKNLYYDGIYQYHKCCCLHVYISPVLLGSITPFRSVRLFCAYACVAVIFCYFYQITFTAACLVYSGRREAANRHPGTCLRVLPKAQARM